MNDTHPPRLRDADDPLGHALTGYQVTPPAEAEARVWQRLAEPKPSGSQPHWRWLAATACLVCVSLGTWYLRRPPTPQIRWQLSAQRGDVTLQRAAVTDRQASTAPLAAGDRVIAADGDAQLTLGGGGTVLVTRHSRVQVANEGQLALLDGQLLATVAQGTNPTPVVVTTQSMQLVALNAVFVVHADVAQSFDVYVLEGTITVASQGQSQRLGAGTRYPPQASPVSPDDLARLRALQENPQVIPDLPPSGALDKAPAKAPAPMPSQRSTKPAAPKAANIPTTDDDLYEQAMQRAHDRPKEALELLDRLASKPSERQALARYQAARLCETLDPVQAQKRFAAIINSETSPFDVEARLSLIELSLTRGAFREAQREVSRFVARYPTSERMAELRFLRAELLRQDRGDCQSALSDYDAALGLPARADDAHYFRAWCLYKLGEHDLASTALKRYLSLFPQGRHVAQARARLDAPSQQLPR